MNLLKSVVEDQGVSTRGGKIHLGSGSKDLPVVIGKPKVEPKASKFSHEALKKIQVNHNLSDKTMRYFYWSNHPFHFIFSRSIAGHIRSQCERNSVLPYFKESLTDRNSKL